jgi:hypothetical protein
MIENRREGPFTAAKRSGGLLVRALQFPSFYCQRIVDTSYILPVILERYL